MSFSLLNIFGFKSFEQKREESEIAAQQKTDREVAALIESTAQTRFSEWKEDEFVISRLDKTKPYWQFGIPIRCEFPVGNGIYYVDHYETAKYKNVSWNKLVNERVEELKLNYQKEL